MNTKSPIPSALSSLTLAAALAAAALALPGCDPGDDGAGTARVACGDGELCAPEDWQIDGLIDRWRADLGVSTEVCAATRDRGSDGTIDESWTLEHTPGRVAVLFDRDADGNVDDSYDLDYDARLAVTHWSYDQCSDGEAELEDTWTYLLDGRLAGEELSSAPSAATRIALRKLWSYFQDGHMTVSIDDGLDGLDEKRTIRVDAAGRPMFEEADRAGADGQLDGIADARVIRTFGVYGPLVEADTAARQPQQVTTFSYDDDGLSTGWTLDRDGDGIIDATMTLTRAANGRLVRRQYAETAPENRDASYTIDYTLCASK
jgi:hypothetical protein